MFCGQYLEALERAPQPLPPSDCASLCSGQAGQAEVYHFPHDPKADFFLGVMARLWIST
jgi:hypothetical protein